VIHIGAEGLQTLPLAKSRAEVFATGRYFVPPGAMCRTQIRSPRNSRPRLLLVTHRRIEHMTKQRPTVGGGDQLDRIAGSVIAERGNLAGQQAPVVDQIGHLVQPGIIVSPPARLAGGPVENYQFTPDTLRGSPCA